MVGCIYTDYVLFISENSEEGVNVKIQRKYIGLQNKIKSLFSLIIFQCAFFKKIFKYIMSELNQHYFHFY